jgi:hypothetical protein
MSVKTPKTVVLKTVLVGSAKLPTPADRIGAGLTTVAAYPTDTLSLGRFPSPRNPEPESFGLRQEVSAMQMRQQQMHATATAAAPAGRAGRPAPGATARWCPWSVPGLTGRVLRVGRDCQSPDASNARKAPDARLDRAGDVTSAAAAAGK